MSAKGGKRTLGRDALTVDIDFIRIALTPKPNHTFVNLSVRCIVSVRWGRVADCE
jgi:hypothetical protein